jgi:hypothetical protein
MSLFIEALFALHHNQKSDGRNTASTENRELDMLGANWETGKHQ